MLKKLLPILFILLLLAGCSSTKRVEYGGKYFTVNTKTNTVFDGANSYSYTASGNAVEITYPNGAWYYSGKNGISYSDDYHETVDKAYTDGGFLAEAVRKAEGNPETRLFTIFGGLLLGALGLSMLLFPEIFFYLRYGWMFRNAEPSDGAILWCRFSGGVAILLAIIFVLVNS